MPNWMPKSTEPVWTPKSAIPVGGGTSSVNMPQEDNSSFLDKLKAGYNKWFSPEEQAAAEKRHPIITKIVDAIDNPLVKPVRGDIDLDTGKENLSPGSQVYNRLIRPMTSPSSLAMLGHGALAGIKGAFTRDAANKLADKEASNSFAINTINERIPNKLEALPPAPDSVVNELSNPKPQTRFYSGAAGLADNSQKYKLDTASPGVAGDITRVDPPVLSKSGNVLSTPGGVVLPGEMGSVNDIPAMQAAETGYGGKITQLGQPPQFHQPENLEQGLQQIKNITENGVDVPQTELGPVDLPRANDRVREYPSSIIPKANARKFGLTNAESDAFNAGDWKPKSAEPVQESSTTPTVKADSPVGNPLSSGKSNESTNTNWYRKVSSSSTPKDAVRQWAWGRNGSFERGKQTAEKFSDISDPSLVDKYEAGDRTGRLADVEKYFNGRLEEGRQAGILAQDQKKLNYLRHEYEQSPSEVEAALNAHVAKIPSIAKTRQFESYSQAEQAGLTRKYKTIPEIINAYETKFHQAIRNKEFYDYLNETKQLKKGVTLSTNMNDWSFAGPNAEKLQGWVHNVMNQKPVGTFEKALKKTGDIVSLTKNLRLAGGIPYTKYNMHAWNIGRSDYKLEGITGAAKELFTDATGKKAEAYFNENKHLLPDLIEHGYVFHPEDTGKEINPLLDFKSGNKFLDGAGKTGSKIIDKSQTVFERALFERALPALKLKRASELIDKLTPSLGKEKALQEAASISNDFYGGVDKALRSSKGKDLSRIGFLAPDWLESRARLAKRDYVGLAKLLTGKSDAVSNIGAKSFARGSALTAGVLGSKLAFDKFNGKSSDALDFPIGDLDSKDKSREIQAFGTSDDAQKIPVLTALKSYEGNPGALVDLLITNRLSTPAKSAMNIIRAEDDFHKPLRGDGISGGKAIVNYLNELSSPIQHQVIQSMFKYLNGDISGEEALTTAAELPVKYSRQPSSRFSVSMPR